MNPLHEKDIEAYLRIRPNYRDSPDIQKALDEQRVVDMPVYDWPKDREELVLTNLQTTIPIPVRSEADHASVDKGGYATFLEFYLDMYAKVKETAPDLPVYNIHNHPSYNKKQVDDLHLPFSVANDEEAYAVGSTPSLGDLNTWSKGALSILTRGGIHHMRYNETVVYQQERDIDRATHFIVKDTWFTPSSGNEEDDIFFLIPDGPRYQLILAPESVVADEAAGEKDVSFAEWQEFKNSIDNNIDYSRLTYRRPDTEADNEKVSLDDGSLILNEFSECSKNDLELLTG